jgi:molybdopterin synthase sulfur carrier subunit
MISIRIPTPLRTYSGGREELPVQGATLKAVLDDLERQAPGLKERLLNEKGALRPYINVFLNDEDVRFGEGLNTALKDGDKLSIVPAIAGG